MKPKKILKNALGFAVTGVGFGLGAQVASAAGSPEGASAIGKMSKAIPTICSIYMAGEVMDELNSFSKTTTKKKKYKF